VQGYSKKTIPRLLKVLAQACLVGLGMVTVVIVFQMRSWPLELFHHFVPHYFFVGLILLVYFIMVRSILNSAITMVIWLCLLAVILNNNIFCGVDNKGILRDIISLKENDIEELTVITVNMFDKNPEKQFFKTWIASQPADLILLQETPAPFEAKLAKEKVYPYQFSVFDPSLDNKNFPHHRSITILSRYPFLNVFKIKPAVDLRVAAFAQIEMPDGVHLWIAAVDCLEPKKKELMERRDRYLTGLADQVAKLKGPVIVAGDFNATQYTPVFRYFRNRANLRLVNAMRPTWPSWLGFFGIRIDHVLVRNIDVKGIEIFNSIGSDHRTLRVTLVPVTQKQMQDF